MGLWVPTGRMRKTMLKKASECVQGSGCCSFLLAWGSDDPAQFSVPPHAQPSSAFRAAQLCDGASCALEGEQHPWPPPTDARGTSPIVTTKTVCAKCSQTHTGARKATHCSPHRSVQTQRSLEQGDGRDSEVPFLFQSCSAGALEGALLLGDQLDVYSRAPKYGAELIVSWRWVWSGCNRRLEGKRCLWLRLKDRDHGLTGIRLLSSSLKDEGPPSTTAVSTVPPAERATRFTLKYKATVLCGFHLCVLHLQPRTWHTAGDLWNEGQF